MNISEKFVVYCHSLYDKIHGNTIIDYYFGSITSAQLVDLIKIYKESHPFYRWKNINEYIMTKKNLNKENSVAFYMNALQHFTEIYN